MTTPADETKWDRVTTMTVQELIDALKRLADVNPEVRMDSPVVVSVGILTGAVRQRLRDDDCPLPVLTFADEMLSVGIDVDCFGEEGPWPIIIHGGAESEAPPSEDESRP